MNQHAQEQHMANSTQCLNTLQLVVVLVESGDLDRRTVLALAHTLDKSTQLIRWVQGIALHQFPVVEHTLRECLSRGSSSQVGHEPEGLQDREVGIQVVDRGTRAVVFLEDVSALLI